MAFLCPVRLKKERKKDQHKAPVSVGRITGSASLDTLAQVQTAKQSGANVHMVIVQDFEPCVSDEIRVKRGEQVKVLYQENDWLYVLTADGREGFVPYNYCLPLERSVDDFVPLNGEKEERQVKFTNPIIRTESCSAENGQAVPTKSVPDIAWNCEAVNRGSRLQSSRLTRSMRSDTGSAMIRRSNIAPASSVRHSFSAKHEDNEFRLSARGFERNRLTSSAGKHSTGSSLMPCSTNPKDFRHKVNVDDSRAATSNDQSDQHIYVNEDIVGSNWLTRQTCSNKPDILPTSVESAGRSRDMVSNQSGSNWRNLSIRSAPDTWPGSSSHRSANQRLEQQGTPRMRQNAQEISYTTAQVTCDLFRSNSEMNISVFAKSNKGSYVVLYDFEKQDEGDLTVRKGEFVTVLNMDDPDWYWVINRWNEEGFVPASYLHSAKDVSSSFSGSHKPHGSTPAISHSRSVSLPVTSQVKGHNDHPDLCPLDLSNSMRLVCLYSYTAESEQHLSISRGDLLYADYDSQSNEDWLWVYSPKRHQSGYVPRSYVKAQNFGYHGRVFREDASSVADVRAVRHVESRTQRDLFTSP